MKLMVSKKKFRKDQFLNFCLAFFLLYLSFRIVNFAYLVTMYGFDKVLSGQIYFVSFKPHLVVSNGDVPSTVHTLLHFISFGILWFTSINITLPFFHKLRNKNSSSD